MFSFVLEYDFTSGLLHTLIHEDKRFIEYLEVYVQLRPASLESPKPKSLLTALERSFQANGTSRSFLQPGIEKQGPALDISVDDMEVRWTNGTDVATA